MTKSLLRLPRVLERTGLSRTHLYRLAARGAFPTPVKISERASAWLNQRSRAGWRRAFARAALR
jgi:prophage regulatory protein